MELLLSGLPNTYDLEGYLQMVSLQYSIYLTLLPSSTPIGIIVSISCAPSVTTLSIRVLVNTEREVPI